jgi:hypothetical protein
MSLMTVSMSSRSHRVDCVSVCVVTERRARTDYIELMAPTPIDAVLLPGKTVGQYHFLAKQVDTRCW